MKIIQSLITEKDHRGKPVFPLEGWKDLKLQLMSCALSVMQLKKHYNEIVLITDDFGKHILTEVLNLPYTSVSTDLNQFNDYPQSIKKTIGKVFSSNLQSDPFIHVERTLYLWNAFPKHIEEAPVVVQHLEKDFPEYLPVLDECKRALKIPSNKPEGKADIDYVKEVIGFYTGVFGGNNLEVIKQYAEFSMELIEEYKRKFSGLKSGHNIFLFLERYLLFLVAIKNDMEPRYLIDNIDTKGHYHKFTLPHEAIYKANFTNIDHDDMLSPNTRVEIQNRLMKMWPEAYYTLLDNIKYI